MPVDPRFLSAFRRVFEPAPSVVSPVRGDRRDDVVLVPDGSAGIAESLPSVALWRARDLASIRFRFVNLTLLETDGGRVVARAEPARSAHLVAEFGPQHLLEQAFFDASGDTDDFVEKGDKDPDPPGGSETPDYPVRAQLARGSRIVFSVSDERIPFSEAGLLDAMTHLPLSVAPHAEGAALILDWSDIADRIGALDGVVARSSALRAAMTRRIGRRARVDVHSDRVRASNPLTLAVGRAVASELALDDAVAGARLRRTAAQLEQRFGAHSAVAGVARGLPVDVTIGPLIDLGNRPPPPREPTGTETAIELPWRLQLSPNGTGGFAHAVEAVERTGRVELWHTRLGTRIVKDGVADVDESPSASRTVRAIWTRDFTAGAGPAEGDDAFPDENLGDPSTLPPFRASLSARDRMQLVHLTSNHRYPNPDRLSWRPVPVPVENLMLSSLGGWLASDVHFPPAPGELSIEEWQHRATMGRDHFVKVVYAGVLLPFGHRASLVKVSERRVGADGRATLYQRLSVVVREPERRFLATGQAAHDNAFPFRWVRILTSSTPPLARPTKLSPEAEGQIFIPSVATADAPVEGASPTGDRRFPFRLVANDVDDHLVEFEGPLVFVEKSVFSTARSTKQFARIAANAALPAFDLRGQRIAFAPPADPDDTALATATIAVDAIFDTTTADRSRNFVLPTLRVATSVVPAMNAFTGQSDPKTLTYATAYRDNAFAAGNAGGLFLQLADAAGTALAAPAPLAFSRQADRSGAFLSPDIGMTALARRVGPVGGDLATLAASPTTFDAGSMFAALDGAKLFGVLPLSELLPAGGSPLPTFVTRAVNTVVAVQQAISSARTFVLQYSATLASQGGTVQQTADDLAASAEALADAIVDFSAPPHPAQDFATLLGAVVADARDLRDALVAPVAPLGIPRSVVEGTDALLSRIADIGADVAAVATLVERFYSGALLPEQVSARLEWETRLVPWSPGGVAAGSTPVFQPGGDETLRLVSEVQAPLTGGVPGPPTALVSCSLPPFTLTLLGDTPFIAIRVAVMEFSVRPGRKPDVNVELDPATGIEFLGPLAFVETLKEIIPFYGFSDPPYLDVQPSGLKAGFDLAIPDLAVGVFALTNVRLGAELSVPFIGESLEFRFFFSTREDPFRLSVAFFAGGGFFAITISPKGLKMIEASFEFGAAVEMSFAVASGSLSVMAGIYFRLEIDAGQQNVQLTGFFRARGEVDVLGLISACIELYLELSYRSIGSSAKAVGKASISIEVSVCFFSFSVSVSCEKQFAGSSGDPTFVDAMGPYTDALGAAREPWSEYCGAFAPEEV
jgi:hypothetical protein